MNEVNPPTETELAAMEAKVRRRPPGTQLKVGGEVYLRLDGEGRRRFHYRGLNGIPGGTRDSWQEAYEARQQVKQEAQKALDVKALLGALRLPAELDRLRALVARMDRDELRKLPLVYYAAGAYWPDMQTKLELITRLDYQADLALLRATEQAAEALAGTDGPEPPQPRRRSCVRCSSPKKPRVVADDPGVSTLFKL
jgi:hypothetical protein